jgi:hypothetical protein
MSKSADLSPWVNRATLRHLIREFRKHREPRPVRRREMALYLLERDELIALKGVKESRVPQLS